MWRPVSRCSRVGRKRLKYDIIKEGHGDAVVGRVQDPYVGLSSNSDLSGVLVHTWSQDELLLLEESAGVHVDTCQLWIDRLDEGKTGFMSNSHTDGEFHLYFSCPDAL